MSGIYYNPIKRIFLNLSGGTVTGDTIFTQNLSASTYYSGATPLEEIIYNISTQVSSSGDTYVTGFTYNNANQLTLSRNRSEPPLSVFINDMTGLTVSGDLSANTVCVENKIEPTIDNIVELGSVFKRFRSLNTVNGVAVNFTATTRVTTPEIILGTTVVTENNIILSGNCVDGGVW